MDFTAFADDAGAVPAITLRGGNEIDNYNLPIAYDAELDRPSDVYLRSYYWGISHLDAASWRHYLPRLMEYALAHQSDGGDMVIDSLLGNLRSPDRTPPRFGSLKPEQRKIVEEFLDHLAFDDSSAWKDEAQQLIEEYWGPGSLYGEDPSG